MSGAIAVPISFGPPDAWCFGWYHAAHLTPAVPRGRGVVLCRPLGFEAHCTYETYTQLAEQLAQAGFAVIRFDYHGCGDSSGQDTDPDRVNAWVSSTVQAIHEVKRLGGVQQVALFGVRLGATLAAAAASMVGGVDSLVMWAPCVTGRAFARELRASSATPLGTVSSAAPADIQALGYTYTAQTLQDLHTLDCQRPALPPARRVMIVGRDDLPIEGPLPAAYKAMGLDTTYTVLPGYAGIMVEPHDGMVPTATLGLIAEWLCAAPTMATAAASTEAMPAASAHLPALSPPSHCVADGALETPLSFGPSHKLFGILTQPACAMPLPAATHSHPDTAILMITVAANHRIGPNRLHVALARAWAAAGYASFRFDLAGIGDSRVATGFPGSRLFYSNDNTQAVLSAIDGLAVKGFTKFIAMGLCSGAYLAFQAAQVDPRVVGQILMNPRRLELQADNTLQDVMQSSYKSIHYYRRALLDINVYRRVLRGEVNVKGIARRVSALLKARLARALARVLARVPGTVAHHEPVEDSVLGSLKALGARGTDTLMVVGAEDDGRDYVEFHLGHRGSKLSDEPNFQITFIEGSDHTFAIPHSQQMVVDVVQTHLDNMTALRTSKLQALKPEASV